DDVVSISNLQRQIIHRMDDLGVNKAHSAQRFARDLNPETDLLAIAERLDDTNCDALVRGHDVVLDGTDRYRSRQTIARACARAEIPLVSGAVNMFDGQLCVFAPHLADANGQPSPRFHDLYPTGMRDEDFPACEATGILGASTGVIGSLMAMEAIKLATGVGEPLIGRLLMYDGRHARFTELEFSRMAEDR
ncbi:MAG TPA: HesA/MoeB/ThiF family protein, partial [Devosia sp.]|nr:HesA/MoeB/ThiF family protein [Devosia sp.]